MNCRGQPFRSSPKPATVMALQIVTGEDGKTHTGRLQEIALTSELAVCGNGFNDKAVKVRLGGSFYFVFREHLGWSVGKTHPVHRSTDQ
ncbi:MAG: hypothetical protein JO185_08695 [Acidobacteriaceae bacterium]|nr:hypothetical protein [Acidobacteriaceae bacterium]MBV9225631.1 hypothetical protein [Acidobacteriaceae bacterium]MBV9306020.1 hypothetical protein [Acidobacteriaceae bacterium]MBV9676399.1 hypothetical protein [Acidobacteriaceae bacterium]